MRDARWPQGAFVAEFEDEPSAAAATSALAEHGYTALELYSPYPAPDAARPLGHRRSLLPALVFAGGLTGALLGYGIQWYANVVSYPLNIGGRPVHAIPAFFIPTFEATVLCASLTAFIGVFALLRLPRPWHPLFEIPGIEHVAVDRFWIAVDATDPMADESRTPETLWGLRARRVVRLSGEPS